MYVHLFINHHFNISHIMFGTRVVSTDTWTSRGFPNLTALSKFFLNASSRKLKARRTNVGGDQILNRIMKDDQNLIILPGLFYAFFFVFIHEELRSLTWGVDDQGIPVEPLQHDCILGTQVISRQSIGLPPHPLISIRQVLKQQVLMNKYRTNNEQITKQ